MTAQKKNIPSLRFPEFKDEWIDKQLNEIAEVNPSSKEVPTKFKYIDLESVEKGILLKEQVLYKDNAPSRAQRVLKRSDILFQTVRPYQMNNYYFDKNGDYVASTGYAQIRSNINSKFLFQYLHYDKFVKNVILKCTGTSFPAISSSDLAIIEIAYPIDKTEQQKIADFLTAVDKRIEQLTRKKQLLEQYKKGVMQKLFSQQLRFKDDNGKDFPDWEEKKLSQVAEFRRGSFPQPYGLKKWYDDINGFPFVQVFDVDDNMLLKGKTKRKISKAATELSVFAEKGTVVLTIQGSIGRIAMLQYDAYIDRTLLIFKSFKVPINERYLMYVVYLLFDIEKTKAPGGTIKTITKEQLSDFTINIPCINEQQKIGKFLFELDSACSKVQAEIDNINTFKKGLLQQMFV